MSDIFLETKLEHQSFYIYKTFLFNVLWHCILLKPHRCYSLREFSQMIQSCKYNHELNTILNIKNFKKINLKILNNAFAIFL